MLLKKPSLAWMRFGILGFRIHSLLFAAVSFSIRLLLHKFDLPNVSFRRMSDRKRHFHYLKFQTAGKRDISNNS